jgi:hypothetical protein
MTRRALPTSMRSIESGAPMRPGADADQRLDAVLQRLGDHAAVGRGVRGRQLGLTSTSSAHPGR